jgi:hypothetical protein
MLKLERRASLRGAEFREPSADQMNCAPHCSIWVIAVSRRWGAGFGCGPDQSSASMVKVQPHHRSIHAAL